jgi:hypothetical protein
MKNKFETIYAIIGWIIIAYAVFALINFLMKN